MTILLIRIDPVVLIVLVTSAVFEESSGAALMTLLIVMSVRGMILIRRFRIARFG